MPPTPKTPVTRILLVDDHELLRFGLRQKLEQEAGLTVVDEVSNGRDAMPAVERCKPDLVVLDLGLPDLDGMEILRQIRERHPSTKVLVLSGNEVETAAPEAIRNGAQGYVRKEDAGVEILRAVHHIISGQLYLSPVAALALAGMKANGAPIPRTVDKEMLSEREVEVLSLLAEGLSYKEIADRMAVSVRTVETYRARIADKLGCRSRAGMVRYALQHKLLKS